MAGLWFEATCFWFVLIFALGACLGSYVCCQVRRSGKKKKKEKWSHCEHCRKVLRWYDKIPVVSWVILRGRCRYCGKKIGGLEVACEIGGALAFGALFLFWPLELEGTRGVMDGEARAIIPFLLALVFLTILGWLAVLDVKSREVPQGALYVLVAVGLVFWGAREILYSGKFGADLLSLLGGVLILAGIYYALYKISKEKWVGGAEWIVGVATACVLAKWELSLICLVVANIAAALIITTLNGFLKQKIKLVPMLPFLALSFLLTLCIFFDFYVG